jgi:serine/threonine-protein kinase
MALSPKESLTPERFAQVRAIFEAAEERPVAERFAFAAGACGTDKALLLEVEAMLAADGRTDPILDAKPSSSAPEEGRFPAGTILAGRYRILGLLGHGGMGEVYKAFDLILNQTVALKFLMPRRISEAALVRFRNEVRIARQVSHPNVCRVYDLGMVEGLHFLSMEYIDGEDVASLLRRIGRLPQDKAIELTRKICAGLSAAHERGVLHRDLKPANIMIDGRGQIRITDFGLAALADEIPLSDLRSGTPAYMSPEQKEGKEVTTRSDIYALGLVLHELFTGKARYESQSTPTEIVKDLDPAIERLILRCLEEDPKRRPQTALNVAMALPGADPIAAALAAGETPSPEMVAASNEKEGLRVRTAVILFVAIVVCLIGAIAIEAKYGLARTPLRIPPDALADRAQQLLKSIGYDDPSGTVDYGFFCCDQQAAKNVSQYEPARRDEILASHQPPIITFYYRWFPGLQEAGSDVIPVNRFPDETDSSLSLQSGTRLMMNADGKLIRLEAQPRGGSAIAHSIDWNVLFNAAGLDRGRFTESTPESVPSIVSDARAAWSGTYGDNRKEKVRVEAAAWQGRPVLFDVRVFPPPPPPGSGPLLLTFVVPMALLAAAGVITAWRNLRLGRSDRHGAAVIACVAFLFNTAAWLLGPSHNVDPAQAHGLNAVLGAVSQNLLLTTVMWAIYISIEPYVRRNWPDSLISWTRFSTGKFNNVLVASHILIGILVAEAYLVIREAARAANGDLYTLTLNFISGSIGTVGETIGFWFNTSEWGLNITLGLLLAVVLLRALLRKMWLADLVAAVSLNIGAIIYAPWSEAAFWVIGSFISMWVLRRFGLLAFMSVAFFATPSLLPIATSGWFASRSLTLHFVPIAVAAWAVWVIVANQNRPAEVVA